MKSEISPRWSEPYDAAQHHGSTPLMKLILANEAAGNSSPEAVTNAQAGKVRVKAKTEPAKRES